MRKQVVILGVLSMVWGATAQVTPIVIFPDTSNTNKLTACETKQNFFMLMTGTRASLAQTFGNHSAATTLSTAWRDTAFTDSANGPGTRAVYKVGESATDIVSKAFYGDFDVRISFRNTDNSGFFYRGKRSGNYPWNTAVEVAIDNSHLRVPREQTGSVFDIFPPVPPQQQHTFLYSSGRWNEMRIIAVGDSMQHWVNGIKVADYRMFAPDYFAGRGTIAGVNTGYNISKWNASKEMSFATTGNVAAGPILRGLIGVQGAHPGNLMIRNFRIDTTVTWAENSAFYPDTVASCVAAGVRGARKAPEGALRAAYPGNGRLVVSIPGGSLHEAALYDARGNLRLTARVSGQDAEFDRIPGNGVYLVRYSNASGRYGSRISLIGSR